jgi:hypothetical protein
LADSLTALTKARRPSASFRRQAAPGEKPPGWLTAAITAEPSERSTQVRTPSGRSGHGTRGMAGT